ncbi:hypothetical protein ACQY1Q_07230 [Tenacibaculum sp. TC6]|uniref:hypothetical protein n=1 Tax=Tenacibaculum sp. TC6 TaxID=3423223 RepID=UPI003D36EC36
MKQNKETLKQFFETGDKPTQQQYADLIDSYIDSKQETGEANRRFVIDETGEVSVASELTILQSDWNQIDNTQPDFIKNKPDLTNIGLQDLQEVTNQGNSTSNDVVLRKVGNNSTQEILFDTDGDDFSIRQTTIEGSRQNDTIIEFLYNNSPWFIFDNTGPYFKTRLRIESVQHQLSLKNIITGNSVNVSVTDVLTSNREVDFQDKSGTLALLDDIKAKTINTSVPQTSESLNTSFPLIDNPVGTQVINEDSVERYIYMRVSDTAWRRSELLTDI